MVAMAEPATVDLTQLDAFRALLPTLAGALDIRDVFQHLSEVASRIVPHDEANLLLATDDGAQYRLYASTGGGAPELVCREDHCVLCEPATARIIGEIPGPDRDLRSGVCAPVFIRDEVAGVFALFSQRPHSYSSQDLALVQRIADYVAVGVAHQRLAEAARHAAVERARTASIDSSVELLRTIAGVLDVRTVFPQVSEIANKVLPHDLLTMMFEDRGQILFEVASSDGFPDVTRLIRNNDPRPKDGSIIIDDLTTATLPIIEPVDLRERIVSAGYRSVLTVLIRAGDQEMGLGFWSKRLHAFGPHDVPIARRLADHVALAVSHEQLAAAARQVAEAHARVERLESRVQSLVDEHDSKSGNARVVGQSPEWTDSLKKATQVAATETTVLLTGESGTGKEVVARFIHRASARKSGPFVALNCAALPEQLLESELFGYERGAFTGAQQSKPGQIELAAGGVLFLEEPALCY
jgi:transcriptional regulator with GAF, ATPase, and Fis domain